ncbi:pseudouridine synthase [Shewanella sp. AS1]|uniref:pseudouridine synthase n=1 Tax=Shewanella sp. AS1 TaxID=2907626 RepID=UPI001F17850F|nr:pseudouridine synthase [Shewanella sp. AS1]MCE9677872.1 pseudouridine synthase [Shewanella sp. AS1]
MASKRSRLDRYLCKQLQLPQKQVRHLLLEGRVSVNGLLAKSMDLQIDEFSLILLDGKVMQQNVPRYLMLHKPVGVVCATQDQQHTTVIDLLGEKATADLHIVGRLDLNTSGLVLLTNDGRWSRRIMSPEHKVDKCYRVTLQNPLDDAYVKAFATGFYFGFEDITTLPAKLEILTSHSALVTLQEGRYHQIKRMFGRFRNPVVGLHRLSVGDLRLDTGLQVGESRALTPEEVALFMPAFSHHDR